MLQYSYLNRLNKRSYMNVSIFTYKYLRVTRHVAQKKIIYLFNHYFF